MLVNPYSMDVVTPIILSLYGLESWLFTPRDAKLLEGAPRAGLDCKVQSTKSALTASLPVLLLLTYTDLANALHKSQVGLLA